ncbi:ABC transporter permease [Oceanotoga sp. DSM 15011]|uniref:ABC transporter permease n=1 Tax=unclassified Oceanotoga TaxID=2618448 RepID=UPI0021F48015|nr:MULTISPECIES: ABC transporter permease [unclassified Oceanotoga]MDN5342151.1 osmoprotectant transport system permease protein [Oceanotoga sp.]UYP01057.1 ABC transporter permease [Oceanotoga sp. DSM 15011]
MNIFEFYNENLDYLFLKTYEHLYIFIISWLLAVIIGILIGVFVSRPKRKKTGELIINIMSTTQAIPSIAVIALVFIFLGIGATPAIFALFLYSLVPIIFNTASGLLSVDKKLIEAAKGMGMTNFHILFRIEIPMSISSIFSGLRNSAVINIATTTVASAVGAGGLGELIFIGLSAFDYTMILAGALPVSLLAVIIDQILGLIEKFLTSKGIKMITEN